MISSSVAGKKLLVLGGFAQNVVVIKKAKDMGCHVTVVDYLENSPGKLIADDHYLISITDVDSISSLCRETQIDGIMNYCIDPGQKPYQQICQNLGYPCYGTAEQFEVLTNKDLFHQKCLENGVGVVDRYNSESDETFANKELIEYPVIVKPADGRSSKGITKCESERDLEPAIETALEFSVRKKVIIERFMDCPEVCAKYFVCDGESYLTSFSDTYTGSVNNRSTAINGKFYPSKYFDQFKLLADVKIRRMIKSIGIVNGPLSFTGFYSQEGFHFFDPSYRLGGAQQWRIEASISGIDVSDALTTFALTGDLGISDRAEKLETDFQNIVAGQLFVLAREGAIKEITGVDQALEVEGVIGHYFNHRPGDIIKQFGTTDHVVITVHMVARDKSELLGTMTAVQDYIDVLDCRGVSMMLPKLDLAQL